MLKNSNKSMKIVCLEKMNNLSQSTVRFAQLFKSVSSENWDDVARSN